MLVDGKRQWRWLRFIGFGILPVVLGILLSLRLDPPDPPYLPLIVAVYSVLAAVLVGLIPLVHSVIGQSDPDRKYDAGQRPLAQQEIDRIQTLQDLHAAISYATILLVVSLGACVVLVFLLPASSGGAGTASQPHATAITVLAYCLTAIVYAVGASTALTFFDVATGVFEAMESHAESLKRRIRGNVAPDEEHKDDEVAPA